VLGLGNDILGDDAVGLLAARRLRTLLPDTVDVMESGGAGLDLLDVLEGYDRALLLDSILTGKHPPGTILEFSGADFKTDDARSPHYAGLPTVIRLAENLGIDFPLHLQVLAVEIENPYEVTERLSSSMQEALPVVIERARRLMCDWLTP
jgi:hydrogenase maturation protease